MFSFLSDLEDHGLTAWQEDPAQPMGSGKKWAYVWEATPNIENVSWGILEQKFDKAYGLRIKKIDECLENIWELQYWLEMEIHDINKGAIRPNKHFWVKKEKDIDMIMFKNQGETKREKVESELRKYFDVDKCFNIIPKEQKKAKQFLITLKKESKSN